MMSTSTIIPPSHWVAHLVSMVIIVSSKQFIMLLWFQDYPPDDTSISDPPHTTFLHFVRSLGGGGHKEDYPLLPDIVRPGSDIQDYLRDLLVKSPR